jgi:hypothetical protein
VGKVGGRLEMVAVSYGTGETLTIHDPLLSSEPDKATAKDVCATQSAPSKKPPSGKNGGDGGGGTKKSSSKGGLVAGVFIGLVVAVAAVVVAVKRANGKTTVYSIMVGSPRLAAVCLRAGGPRGRAAPRLTTAAN